MASPLLPLKDMAMRHRGLTSALAEAYLEAARVCLDRHHTPPQSFSLRNGNSESMILVDWQPDEEIDPWTNTNDATCCGAYAIALAATEIVLGLFAVRRAETLTGADYYVGPVGCDTDDLEHCFRLEVSGTHLETKEVNKRLRDKTSQVQRGRSSLPAIAVVVGFRVRLIAMQSVEGAS